MEFDVSLYLCTNMKHGVVYILLLLFVACTSNPQGFEAEVLLPYSPVKNQGKLQLCWAYAMLSTIETDLMERGDSARLPVRRLRESLEKETDAPQSMRGMGATTLRLIKKYGLYSDVGVGEYVSLTTTKSSPYGDMVMLDVPDNWDHNSFLNVEPDSLLKMTEQAVRHHYGICWEGDVSELGFDWKKGYAVTSWWNGSTTDDHCMAIVGIAHDEKGEKYFIMKNSWGKKNPYGGLMYLSYGYFLKKTIAVYMSCEASGL